MLGRVCRKPESLKKGKPEPENRQKEKTSVFCCSTLLSIDLLVRRGGLERKGN